MVDQEGQAQMTFALTDEERRIIVLALTREIDALNVALIRMGHQNEGRRNKLITERKELARLRDRIHNA